MFKFGKKKTEERSNRWIFGTMLAFGIIGLIASFVLSIEKIHLLEDPNAALSCSINLVLNCSTVMQTWQATVFGFPNSFIGLMGYSVVITVAIVGLAGVALPRLFWQLASIGYFLGLIFAYWLFFSSVYVIEVLCPWCLFVTFATTLVFVSLHHRILRDNVFNFSKAVNKRIQAALDKDVDKLITASWIVLLIALIFIKFGESLFV